MTTVSFTLMDENNLPITFSPGVPTIIKLNIFEMNNSVRNFYVKTSNYASRDIFTSNKCFSFVTRLSKEMVLDNTWKVGITSIFLPKNIYNIYKSMNTIIIEDDTSLKVQNSRTYELIPGYYHSDITLCNLINNECLYSIGLSLRIGENGRFLLISMDDSIVSRKIKIHKKLAGILGIPEDCLIRDFSDHISFNFKHLEEKNGYYIMVCEEFRTMNSLQEIPNECFPLSPNIHFSLSPWIFVYSSIVQPSILGHLSIPLLKIIPTSIAQNNTGTFYEFDNVEYFSLGAKSFQDIRFELRDYQGSLIETENGQSLITLSFKQY